MKLVILSTLAAHAYSQSLTASCDNDNLVLDIPYPDERTAKLLYLQAGNCDETNYNGDFNYDSTRGVAVVTIPITACGMENPTYSTPLIPRAGGLYRPQANVTFGEKIGDFDVIFRNMNIAAECGVQTSYKATFEYNNIQSADKDGCVEIDGVCVFDAYEQNVVLEIKEYTDDTFTTEVNPDGSDRADLAGETIYLSLRQTQMPAGYKFAVSECVIIDANNDTFTMLSPETGSCDLAGVGLTAEYNNQENFDFSHILFMLNTVGQPDGVSSFRLECTAEICAENDPNSKCNTDMLPCSQNSLQEKIDYMCPGFCDGPSDVCTIGTDDVPLCN